MKNTPVNLQSLSLLRDLVAFDSTSRNSNLGLIEWARDLLRHLGAGTRLSYDAGRGKANLFATLGEGALPGLILSGHTDVVPVDGQEWASDPFAAELRDGRVYGRGSCDMKGFIACALAAAPAMASSRCGAPFHLALTYDEEVGCLGVRTLLADLAEAGISAAGCIVGEPTGMEMVIGHKGRREMRCSVHGREAHSSLPGQGVSAVEYAAQLIALVQRMAGDEAANGLRDSGFDVPYATLHCGMVQGGTAANTIARDCSFSVEARYLPGNSAEGLFDHLRQFGERELLPAMRERSADAGIDWQLVNDTPAFSVDEQEPLVERLSHLLASRQRSRVAYNTEAGLFQRYGIPTVLCGPGHIAQAHRADEYVALEQLAACNEFLSSLIATQSLQPLAARRHSMAE